MDDPVRVWCPVCCVLSQDVDIGGTIRRYGQVYFVRLRLFVAGKLDVSGLAHCADDVFGPQAGDAVELPGGRAIYKFSGHAQHSTAQLGMTILGSGWSVVVKLGHVYNAWDWNLKYWSPVARVYGP